MTETFLNGRLTVTSLAAPTDEDNAKLDALTSDERHQVLAEAIEHGRASGISDRDPREAFKLARARYARSQAVRDHAV